MTKFVVKIENDYSDGHHSERTVEVDGPTCPGHSDIHSAESFYCDGSCLHVTDWFDDAVYPETGDGHGADSELGSCYSATVVSGPRWVGESYEWTD
jgi:hypothetical protein